MAIPSLTKGSVATVSITDSEAIQRTMENLTQIISEFRESDMRQKLRDCQGFQIYSSNHAGAL